MRFLARIAIILALIPAASFAQNTNRGALYAPNNLSDLPDPAQARTNLGLGALSVLSSLAGVDASATDLTDPNGANVATLAGRFGEVLDVIGGFGASPAMEGSAGGTIATGSATLLAATGTTFPAGAAGDVIWVDGIGPNGEPLDTTISAVASAGGSITLAAAASFPSGNDWIQYALPSTPGTGCVPLDTRTLTGGVALAAGQLTITSCGVFGAASSMSVAAAGSGGPDNTTCVVDGTTGTVPTGFGYARFVVTTNASGELSTIVSVYRPGTYVANPTNLADEPVTAGSSSPAGCHGLTGAAIDIGAAQMGVETVTPTVRGSYSVVPSPAGATGTGAESGDQYTLTTGVAGVYDYGRDSTASLAAAITTANNDYAATGLPQSVALPAGNIMVDGGSGHSTCLPAATNGVSFNGAGIFRTRIFIGPSYGSAGCDSLFAANQAGLVGTNAYVDNQWNMSAMAPGPVFRNFGIFGDLGSKYPVTAFDFQREVDHFIIEDVFIRPLYGRCLFVGDLTSGSAAYAREWQVRNLQCLNAGTPLTPAEAFNSTGTGTSDSTNTGTVDTRIFSAQGPGIQILSQNTHKTTTYLDFPRAFVEYSGAANEIADGIDVGTETDAGGISAVHFYALVEPSMANDDGCMLRLGGGVNSTQSYNIQVFGGDLGPNTYGVCYGNVRNTEIHLDSIGADTDAVVAGPGMGALNYLTEMGLTNAPVEMLDAYPQNLLFSEPGVLANLGTARLPGFTYGPDYAGTLTNEPPATGKLYAERFDVGATSVLKSLSFDVGTALAGGFDAEMCVYRDSGGVPSALLLDTGSFAVGDVTGVQTDTLATPLVLPGPGEYTIGFMASAAGESIYSMIPSGITTSPGSLASSANQWGANSAATLFAGTSPAGQIAIGTVTFGGCPASPSLSATGSIDIPYVALGF